MFGKLYILILPLILITVSCDKSQSSNRNGGDETDSIYTSEYIDTITDEIEENHYPTMDDGSWMELTAYDLRGKYYHTKHAEIFGDYAEGYNYFVLEAIDIVQKNISSTSGGGYFADTNAIPLESPIGYELSFMGNQLLTPPRTTSYCSGATYAALIESLNLILDRPETITEDRIDVLMMQEEDGSPREPYFGFWGCWNAPYGNLLALVEYSGMGKQISPENARPGDFLYFERSNGTGHMAIFLGYYVNMYNERKVIYWSSQSQTDGLGDGFASIGLITNAVFVRLTNPEKIFSFNTDRKVEVSIEGDRINWW